MPSESPRESLLELSALRQRAAHLGPGWFGVRRDGTDAERLALARRFTEIGETAPVYLLSRCDWIDRRARLFQTGLYGSEVVARERLAQIAAAFDAPLALRLESSEAPLGLGYVTAVDLEGDALFGTVTLSAEADALLRSLGASSLTVALDADLSGLAEVSLVADVSSGRRLLATGPYFETVLEVGSPAQTSLFGDDSGAFSNEEPSDPALALLLRRGQLLPDQLEAAERLLETGRRRSELDGGEIRRLLLDLLEARPPIDRNTGSRPAYDPSSRRF